MDNLNLRSMIEKLALLLFVIALACPSGKCYGFDAGASCSEKTARRGRAQLLKSIPCDLTIQAYCNLPGSLYPWNAVRRFVNENQGMMKRMYGDVRHISVLRTEINNNDIGLDDVEEAAVRYSRAGWKRNKYLHQEKSNSKNNDLLSEAHYRRATVSASTHDHSTSRTTFRTTPKSSPTQEKSTSTAAITISSTIEPTTSAPTTTLKIKPFEKREKMTTASDFHHQNFKYNKPYDSIKENDKYEDAIEAAIEEIFVQFQNDDETTVADENVFKNITEAPPMLETETSLNNIKIVGAPDLSAFNKTDAATISTTLRIYGFSKDEKVTTLSPLNKTTESVAVDVADELKVKENGTTVKEQVNEDQTNMKNNDDIDGSEDGSVEDEDSTSAESLGSETMIDVDRKQPDKLLKPDENSAGQLFQDVAQNDEPVYVSSRGVNACPVKEEVVAPFWANNTRGEVLALLNLYPFEQYVHWEKCTQEHKQMYCRDGCRCEQQYRLHRLLAYDPQNECRGIFSDWFRFPSCCICKCYDIPLEYRVTSRSPRSMGNLFKDVDDKLAAGKWRHPIDNAEDNVYQANYDHVTNDWYRRAPYELGEMDMIAGDEQMDF